MTTPKAILIGFAMLAVVCVITALICTSRLESAISNASNHGAAFGVLEKKLESIDEHLKEILWWSKRR